MKYVVFEIEDDDVRPVLIAVDPRGGEVMYRKLAEGGPLEAIEAIVRASSAWNSQAFAAPPHAVYHPDPPVVVELDDDSDWR